MADGCLTEPSECSEDEEDAPEELPWESLRQPVMDLLLKFYNGDEGEGLIQAVTKVMAILSQWATDSA